jgi:hypothetical protein
VRRSIHRLRKRIKTPTLTQISVDYHMTGYLRDANWYRHNVLHADITKSTATFTTANVCPSSLLSNVFDFVYLSRTRATDSPFYLYGLRKHSTKHEGLVRRRVRKLRYWNTRHERRLFFAKLKKIRMY